MVFLDNNYVTLMRLFLWFCKTLIITLVNLPVLIKDALFIPVASLYKSNKNTM